MHARQLTPHDVGPALALIAARPSAHCFLTSLLESRRQADIVAVVDGGTLVAIASLLANSVVSDLDPRSAAVLADHLVARRPRPAAIVGRQPDVALLWDAIDGRWGAPRARRAAQPLMVLTEQPSVAPDPLVRRSVPADFDALFPCCVDMFTHEVGISPVAHGMERAYRQRVRENIASGRSFVRMDAQGVVFKAEIGATSSAVCQVQGVWVRPDLRGTGVAAPAMAAVAMAAMRDIAPAVALYVNDFNVPAVRAYARAGFTQVDTFSTVFF